MLAPRAWAARAPPHSRAQLSHSRARARAPPPPRHVLLAPARVCAPACAASVWPCACRVQETGRRTRGRRTWRGRWRRRPPTRVLRGPSSRGKTSEKQQQQHAREMLASSARSRRGRMGDAARVRGPQCQRGHRLRADALPDPTQSPDPGPRRPPDPRGPRVRRPLEAGTCGVWGGKKLYRRRRAVHGALQAGRGTVAIKGVLWAARSLPRTAVPVAVRHSPAGSRAPVCAGRVAARADVPQCCGAVRPPA